MILGRDGRPISQKEIPGKLAIRMMIEEIGLEIGARRLREFETKVRAQVRRDHPFGASAQEWIDAMALVIVADDDKKADTGFRRGIRRIRRAAGES